MGHRYPRVGGEGEVVGTEAVVRAEAATEGVEEVEAERVAVAMVAKERVVVERTAKEMAVAVEAAEGKRRFGQNSFSLGCATRILTRDWGRDERLGAPRFPWRIVGGEAAPPRRAKGCYGG